MKKKVYQFFILPFCVLILNTAQAQVTQSGNTLTVNSTIFPGIIQHQATITPSADSQALRGQRILWLEYGDGGFTTKPNTTRQIGSSPGNYFLLTNRLYDTTFDTRMAVGQMTGNTSRTSGDNDIKLVSTQVSDILITPNVYDIVKSDTMCFAITYRIDSSKLKPEHNYYIAFLYKQNAFEDFNATQFVYNSLTNFRTTVSNGDQNIPISALTNPQITYINGIIGSYGKYVIIKIGNANTSERNVFLSFFTKTALQAGGSTSVKAFLIDQNANNSAQTGYSSIANYEIPEMDFRASHDPNYITQYPVCMQLPKIPRIFNYRIHFQNTGQGPADSVRVTAILPSGMILSSTSSITVKDKIFATDSNANFNVETVDSIGNKVVFLLTRNRKSNLKGTQGLNDALVNPVTMGDIYFDIQSTANTPNILQAHASIEFHSKQTSKWESPVVTNITTSYYSNCTDTIFCNCTPPVVEPIPADSTRIKDTGGNSLHTQVCTKFLGLCWWWWVIIALSVIIIYLMTRKRKEK